MSENTAQKSSCLRGIFPLPVPAPPLCRQAMPKRRIPHNFSNYYNMARPNNQRQNKSRAATNRHPSAPRIRPPSRDQIAKQRLREALSRLSEADPSAPKARHQKRGILSDAPFLVHLGNSNPNRLSGLHGKSARGDGSPLSRLSEADPSAPRARHQKRGILSDAPFLVRATGLEPARSPTGT